MVSKAATADLDLLLDPLSRCLTPESAKRLLDLRADARLQAIVDDLAEKANQGTLTPAEKAQYETFVTFGSFVALLKSKARLMLANSLGTDDRS